MRASAPLPGKNSRLRRSDSFPGGRFAHGGMVPGKISNAPFCEDTLSCLQG
jgi:hypothetical protein